MKNTISNLNGVQQNQLHHLSLSIRRTARPLLIVCYGYRSTATVQSSAFSGTCTVRKCHNEFDFFILIRKEECLSDDALREMILRSAGPGIRLNIIVYRQNRPALQRMKDRYFLKTICRNGIVLYGEPRKLFADQELSGQTVKMPETDHLQFLHTGRKQLREAGKILEKGPADLQYCLLLLNSAAFQAMKQLICTHWGYLPEGNLHTLAGYAATISPLPAALFPCSTIEEKLLYNLLLLNYIDEGFCPAAPLLQVLHQRVSKLPDYRIG